MVCAFIGDYSPVHRTLIGALHHNLGISVLLLSQDKDMDLRVHYSCWLSKPLPTNLPFGRVLCFEKTRGTDNDSLTRQIRDMFKVLVPVLKNQSTTNITPLLATGCQHSDKKIVLQATVQGAISWIQAGLPLKKLKIVVFGDQDADLNKCFTSLKEKHVKTHRLQKKNILSYDIFLDYQPSDMSIVKTLSKNLRNRKKGGFRRLMILYKNWVCGIEKDAKHTMNQEEIKELRRKMTSLEKVSRWRKILNISALTIGVFTVFLLIFFS